MNAISESNLSVIFWHKLHALAAILSYEKIRAILVVVMIGNLTTVHLTRSMFYYELFVCTQGDWSASCRWFLGRRSESRSFVFIVYSREI